MTPIPRAAAPVVWFIRWWVKKPRRLPNRGAGMTGALRWDRGMSRFCPLGLLPMSDVPNPYSGEFAGLADHLEGVWYFWSWWDSQTNARAAVDAVWGKVK